MKVLLSWAPDADELGRVRACLPADADIVAPPGDPYLSRFNCEADALLPHVADAEVLIGWVAPQVVIESAASLRLLVWLHAGVDDLDLDFLRRRDISLCNASGEILGTLVAEQAFTLMAGLAKDIIAKHHAVAEGRWTPQWDPAFRFTIPLVGKSLCIVGYGRTGKEVAKRAKAFGMRVVGVKRNPDIGTEFADAVLSPQELNGALGEADFVVLTVPLTARTRHLIGEAELKAMKAEAFLINVARGHIVAEPALHRALSEGWIAGFASDVWWDYSNTMPPSYHYPVPSRTGVNRLPNVLASGDASANSFTVKDAMLDEGLASLAAFAKGEPLPRLVDLDAGY